jgi:hypothetical protein
MPDDKFNIVSVAHRSFLVTKPKTPGKASHEIDRPLRHFRRDRNADRIPGNWFFDFHQAQNKPPGAARQAEAPCYLSQGAQAPPPVTTRHHAFPSALKFQVSALQSPPSKISNLPPPAMGGFVFALTETPRHGGGGSKTEKDAMPFLRDLCASVRGMTGNQETFMRRRRSLCGIPSALKLQVSALQSLRLLPLPLRNPFSSQVSSFRPPVPPLPPACHAPTPRPGTAPSDTRIKRGGYALGPRANNWPLEP